MSLQHAAGKFAADVWQVMGNKSKAILAVAATVSVLLFWGAGKWLGIPGYPGYGGSLALQDKPATSLLLTCIVLTVATGVSAAVAGSVRFDGGLFGASVGLAAMSARGGPMRYVTQAGGGRGVFAAMAAEVALLGAMLGVAWFGQWLLYRRGALAGDALRDGLKDQPHPTADRLIALVAQALAFGVLLMLLARTDEKKQVLAAVCVASFFATLLAYTVSPARPSVWYWAGPIVVGVVGYIAAYVSYGSVDPVAWKSGQGGGVLAPLARPLPLDYASLGTAGAIAGYWTSRQWQRAKELETEAAHAAARPTP